MSNLGYFFVGLGLLAGYLVAMAAVLFGAAGTLAAPMFWAYLGLFAALCVVASAAVYLLSPDLVRERVRPGEGEQDRVTVRALNLLMFAQLLLAGLDVGRLRWSATAPFPLQIIGLIGFAMGMGLTTWAMLVNRFFSSAVRLQPDRGQHVVTTGPYRLVRHPGYSGALLLLLSIGLALGSWIAIVPILLIVPFLVRRTLIEERMLESAPPATRTTCSESEPGSFRACGESA
jgi:protein-S-isoprenylcysteine O-methyltransferase Ste14